VVKVIGILGRAIHRANTGAWNPPAASTYAAGTPRPRAGFPASRLARASRARSSN